jgi:nucleoside-diphosphate-sugar epimerase
MKVLVLGGTRYFGKRLVELLPKHGHTVTVATRRTSGVDRSDREQMVALASGGSWDLVYDQICYSPDEAAIACEAFEGRVGRYVHTSTASVYTTHGLRAESAFDPFTYPIRMGSRADFDYGEAKRLAEAVFFQKAKFPVVAMRIPIVLGPDDYTGRLEFHIDRVREGKPIVVPNLEAETSYIHSGEAARFLLWLGEGSVTGPINACSIGGLTIGEILERIGKGLGKEPVVVAAGPENDQTPIADSESLLLDTTRARELGFLFEPIRSWFPPLIDQLSRSS